MQQVFRPAGKPAAYFRTLAKPGTTSFFTQTSLHLPCNPHKRYLSFFPKSMRNLTNPMMKNFTCSILLFFAFLALIITTLLYATVAIVALSIVPLEQLSSSEAPLALVVEQGGLFSPGVMAFIGIVAILNGAMIQMIMASRVLYGMANNALIPKLLGYVSPRTRTPTIATILVGILVATFALWFPLVTLAQATSSLVLLVFILVNLSLAAINWRERRWFRLTIPLTGSILCATFAGLQLLN